MWWNDARVSCFGMSINAKSGNDLRFRRLITTNLEDLYLSVVESTYIGEQDHANALDDYEEGSHTVTTNSGLTLSLNDFKYTKIGNFVILSGKATVNTTDGSSTQVTMSLPFASSDRNAVTVNFVSGQNTGDIGLVAYSNNSSNISIL